MTNDNGTSRTLSNKFCIDQPQINVNNKSPTVLYRPNHQPAQFFARLVSNRGFMALALPYVGALGRMSHHVASWTP